MRIFAVSAVADQQPVDKAPVYGTLLSMNLASSPYCFAIQSIGE